MLEPFQFPQPFDLYERWLAVPKGKSCSFDLLWGILMIFCAFAVISAFVSTLWASLCPFITSARLPKPSASYVMFCTSNSQVCGAHIITMTHSVHFSVVRHAQRIHLWMATTSSASTAPGQQPRQPTQHDDNDRAQISNTVRINKWLGKRYHSNCTTLDPYACTK